MQCSWHCLLGIHLYQIERLNWNFCPIVVGLQVDLPGMEWPKVLDPGEKPNSWFWHEVEGWTSWPHCEREANWSEREYPVPSLWVGRPTTSGFELVSYPHNPWRMLWLQWIQWIETFVGCGWYLRNVLCEPICQLPLKRRGLDWYSCCSEHCQLVVRRKSLVYSLILY